MKNLKDLVDYVNSNENKRILGVQSLEGRLRVVAENVVFDIQEFDVSIKPGEVNINATKARVLGSVPGAILDEEVDVKPEPQKEIPETPVITQDEIKKALKK